MRNLIAGISRNRAGFVGICGIFILMLILNLLEPLIGDDWTFRHNSAGIESIKSSFMAWNPRFWELLWRAWLCNLNPFVFDVINAALASVFFALGFMLVFGRGVRNIADCALLACVVVLMICAMSFEEAFLWGSGSANYLWSYIVVICVLLPYRAFWGENLAQSAESSGAKSRKTRWIFNAKHAQSLATQSHKSPTSAQSRHQSRAKSHRDSRPIPRNAESHSAKCAEMRGFRHFAESHIVIFSILSFVAGMGHEALSAMVILARCALLAVCVARGVKMPKWYWAGLGAFVAGFFVLIFSPASGARAGLEATRYDFISLGDFIALSLPLQFERLALCFHNHIFKTPIILAFVLFTLAFFRIYRSRLYKNIVIFTLSFALFAYIALFWQVAWVAIILAMWGFIAFRGENPRDWWVFGALLLWVAMGFVFLQFGKNVPFRARIFDLVFLIAIIALQAQGYFATFRAKTLLLIGGGGACVFLVFHIAEYAEIRLKWNALVDYATTQKARYGENIDLVYPREKYHISYFAASGWWKFREDDDEIFKRRRNDNYALALGVRSFMISD